MGSTLPADYEPFFTDAAGVAGALIGLLFVAVSVAPERMHSTDAGFRVRAGIAFTALTNCLFVTLIGLLPGGNLAAAGAFLAIAGLLSCVWLGTLGARHSSRRRRLAALARVGVIGALFLFQLIACLHLRSHQASRSDITTIAYLILGGFGVAIERSWELVGASGTSVFAHLERMVSAGRSTERPSRDRDDADQRTPGADAPCPQTDGGDSPEPQESARGTP